MFDLVIRNGYIVDGSGKPAFDADIGIANGRIVDVGRVEGKVGGEIDLDGLLVIPGFVDLHTHYDAQVYWDPLLSPSPAHGVTTVISGTRTTLAPMKPEDQDFSFDFWPMSRNSQRGHCGRRRLHVGVVPRMMEQLESAHSASTWA